MCIVVVVYIFSMLFVENTIRCKILLPLMQITYDCINTDACAFTHESSSKHMRIYLFLYKKYCVLLHTSSSVMCYGINRLYIDTVTHKCATRNHTHIEHSHYYTRVRFVPTSRRLCKQSAGKTDYGNPFWQTW